MLKRIDHVALVVPDLNEAIRLYERQLGVEFDWHVRSADADFEVAAFYLGDFHVELLCPIRPDSSISKFLNKRGPGIHHIAFEVDNLETSLANLKSQGLSPVDEEPRTGTGGSRIIFLHPKDFIGTMIELVELPSTATEIDS